MIEHVFNVLLGSCSNKEESFFLWEPLEVNSACMVIQTLKVFYTKSYQRMPREVFGEITDNGSIDNLVTEITSLEESIIERVWCIGGLYRQEIKTVMSNTIVPVYAEYTWDSKSECLLVCGV